PVILPLHEPQGRARLSPGRHSRNQGGRACCPQRAANVNRHSYNLRAADRHALPPNGKIFEKWRDSHVYVSSAPWPDGCLNGSVQCYALVVSRGALRTTSPTCAGVFGRGRARLSQNGTAGTKEVGRVVLNTPRM